MSQQKDFWDMNWFGRDFVLLLLIITVAIRIIIIRLVFNWHRRTAARDFNYYLYRYVKGRWLSLLEVSGLALTPVKLISVLSPAEPFIEESDATVESETRAATLDPTPKLGELASKEKSSSQLQDRAAACKTNVNERMPMITSLSDDLLNQIFLRITSIGSLYSAMLVCKSWYNLITDSHSDRLPGHPLQLMFYKYKDRKFCFFDIESRNNKKITINGMPMFGIEPPIKNDDCEINFFFEMVNSCNGLACFHGTLYDFYVISDVVFVCNPFTGEYVTISPPPISSSLYLDTSECCFGYSSVTNQYKILRTLRRFDGRNYTHRYRDVCWRRDMIYTLGGGGGDDTTSGGNWKSIDFDQQFGCEFEESVGTYLNSAVHCIGTRRHDESWFPAFEGFGGSFIISFDFNKEEYGRFVAQPQDLSILEDGYLSVLGGCLSISTVSSDGNKTEIWMLKEKCDGTSTSSSWTKELVIDMLPLPSILSVDEVWQCLAMQYLKNGRELVLIVRGKYVIYNLDDKSFRRIRLPVENLPNMNVASHTPSLVSLKDILKTDPHLSVNSMLLTFESSPLTTC